MDKLNSSRSSALTQPWTVYVTLRVWPDREGYEPIAEAIENALRPRLSSDESMDIEIVERQP